MYRSALPSVWSSPARQNVTEDRSGSYPGRSDTLPRTADASSSSIAYEAAEAKKIVGAGRSTPDADKSIDEDPAADASIRPVFTEARQPCPGAWGRVRDTLCAGTMLMHAELRESSGFSLPFGLSSAPDDSAAENGKGSKASSSDARGSHSPARDEPAPAADDSSAAIDPSPRPSRTDLLTVTVVEARGLSLPADKHLQENVVRTGESASMTPRSVQSVRQLAIPYVVLEFDKNEVLVLGTGGDIKSPQWQFTANFDVSRRAEVSAHVYLRTDLVSDKQQDTSASGEGSGFALSATDMLHGESSSRRQGGGKAAGSSTDVIGRTDIYLGGVKFMPTLDKTRTVDAWYPVSGGTGEVRMQHAFKSQTSGSLTIEAFDLLKVIGKGSFGKVMQVRKRDTNQIYALKTIRKAHIISRSEVTHTLAERTVLAQVNSPFIVPLKFSFQSPDKLYLVLAFVNGGELFLHLQQEGRFSEERARFYAAELFCALEHLHEFHVVYRDLKTENILLDYTGHIALCDFGLCKLNMGDQETTHTFCGTPEYLAPELLIGHGYTKSVDWWTLGVLLYEMLTGLPPFYSEDVNEMYRRILQEPLTFPSHVGTEARDLLTRLLRRDASRRLGSGPQGAQEIKSHPFFTRHIDWPQLLSKKVQPPYKPGVASAFDTSNFDPEFTSETPLDSVVDDSHLISATVQEQFAGFSYNAASYGANGGSSLRY